MKLVELYELLDQTEKQLLLCDPYSMKYLRLMECRDTLRSSIMHRLEAIILENQYSIEAA